MKEKEFGRRWVPIIPDEARTFGMDSLFPTLKIYSPHGQNYTSVDRELFLSYKEATDGQILHEGINEAGSVASWTAVATSYATHGEPMIPIYIFYSMFGFQRTGDGLWAAADQLVRGFLLGATAGRTTLNGEGLQHADGHSHLLAATNPAVLAYDPAFAYEIAYIIEDGLRRMYGEPQENIFYYLTVYNEPIVQPPQPADLDVAGLLQGLYRYRPAEGDGPRAQLLASGTGMQWALRAQQLLAQERTGLALGSLVVTLWLASRIFTATIRALDQAYNVEDPRGLVMQRGLALALDAQREHGSAIEAYRRARVGQQPAVLNYIDQRIAALARYVLFRIVGLSIAVGLFRRKQEAYLSRAVQSWRYNRGKAPVASLDIQVTIYTV
jgi:hypothetical protein